MKLIIPLLFFYTFASFFTSTSCNKSNSGTAAMGLRDAVITGFDQRLCPCCGGPMINFENNPTPYSGRFYLVENDLSSYGISASSTFPLFVRVEYNVKEKCGDTVVIISKLVKK